MVTHGRALSGLPLGSLHNQHAGRCWNLARAVPYLDEEIWLVTFPPSQGNRDACFSLLIFFLFPSCNFSSGNCGRDPHSAEERKREKRPFGKRRKYEVDLDE
jgi:hypothetical protein